MARIIPFKGIRYNQSVIEDLSLVVTPPYDVIDSSSQERYYQKHPFNIIRLEYGKQYSTDNEENNRYTRAAADFNQWLAKEVLKREKEPALYLYHQEFNVNGERKTRTGLICAVGLEPYEKGIILPHEETLPKHKADRLALMRACRANFSPIFGLYSDPRGKVTGALINESSREPDLSFTDENNESHLLWVIKSPAAITEVQQLMSDKRVYIADGHHRYETALNYMREREESSGKPSSDDAAYKYIMMTLVNLYDPGLVILPTHRLVKNIDDKYHSTFLDSVRENFNLEEFNVPHTEEGFSAFLSELSRRGAVPAGSGESRHLHVFGVYFSGNLYIAGLKDEGCLDRLILPGKSSVLKGLDVSVLHSLVIEKCLGVGEDLRAMGDYITYTRNELESLSAVDRGEYQAAFFLNPTLVEEVTDVASRGEKMPQKSTYFYPKLITGLVINSL